MNMKLDRDRALAHVHRLVAHTWAQFDTAREYQPSIAPEVSALLAVALPEHGVDVEVSLDEAAAVLDSTISQARPRYLGYIGSSGLEIGAIADLLADSHDANLAIDAGAASMLEAQALRWVGEFIGYPVNGGSFTSGGTVSNVTALTAARERALPGSRATGVTAGSATVYCSAEAHYSVCRAVELLGIGSNWLRSIPIDSNRKMCPDALAEAIDADVAAGRTPMAVVATAGTTLTGAIDPLRDIADVCQERGVWLHVDGAYGLPAAAILPSEFAGLERADSVSVDAHKWLFVPKACGVVMVKDATTLAQAFGHATSYIPDAELNAVDITLEYSRPLRALKMWLGFRTHGAQEFREALQRNLDQAQLLYKLASSRAGWEVATVPQLSIVLMRHSDVDNGALVQAIQADGRVYLSHAEFDGETWLRPCFTNPRTTESDVYAVMDIVDELAQGMMHP
jgi:aromatic-L-amino-acid decarboxylase